jgi:hypothetical protein
VITHHAIAKKLSDMPRWIEVRDLLLSNDGEVMGLKETSDLSFILRETGTDSMFVIGTPDVSEIETVIRSGLRPKSSLHRNTQIG